MRWWRWTKVLVPWSGLDEDAPYEPVPCHGSVCGDGRLSPARRLIGFRRRAPAPVPKVRRWHRRRR